MSDGMISLLERGLTSYTQDTLEAIADALDCEVVDLLTRDPEQSEKLWTIYNRATAAQRRQIEQVAQALLNTTEG